MDLIAYLTFNYTLGKFEKARLIFYPFIKLCHNYRLNISYHDPLIRHVRVGGWTLVVGRELAVDDDKESTNLLTFLNGWDMNGVVCCPE